MKPSTVKDQYWLYAWAPPEHRAVAPRVGKWLLFVPDAELDAAWATIETAVEEGRLGPAAKTRTASPGVPGDWLKVICIYTHDVHDDADRERVRRTIQALGFAQELVYKSDADTMLIADLPRVASAMTWADGKKWRHFLDAEERALCRLDAGMHGWEHSNAVTPDPFNQLLCRACLAKNGMGADARKL